LSYFLDGIAQGFTTYYFKLSLRILPLSCVNQEKKINPAFYMKRNKTSVTLKKPSLFWREVIMNRLNEPKSLALIIYF